MNDLRHLVISCLACSFFAWAGLAHAQEVVHVTVQASKGDGAYRILDRYQVRTKCNLAYFYQVNGISASSGLRVGKTYQLPIVVYRYNGKSIRSTTGRYDLNWAKSVQAFNDQLHQRGLKPNDYRNDRALWVPYGMLNCPDEETQPLAANTANGVAIPGVVNPARSGRLRGTYAIFGTEYAQVPLESQRLQGYVYYIVGGHGGPDPGAVGSYGRHSLCEDEYAYDVALRLARNLLSHGATVYLITRDQDDGIRSGEILPCDKDETCWVDQAIPINQSERLTQRSDVINNLYRQNKRRGVVYQRSIVIHVDSNNRNARIDMFFYHKIGDAISKRFADIIHETIKDKYEQYRKGRGYSGTVSSRDLHMLRETDVTTTFIELGNIRNRHDQARFVIEGNRQLVANWLFEGILRDAPRR